MTHTIHHQYDEILQASLPGLEIHVVYHCESEITFDEYGDEESNRLIDFYVTVDGKRPPVFKIPSEKDGSDAQKFLAVLRESARQALWAKALKNAVNAATYDENVIDIAERWQRTGSTKLHINIGKPEKYFVE